MASIYTVKQVNSYIKNMFTQDYALNRIFVKGEISNCKYHSSGHIYFTIKDESGVLLCVMFVQYAKMLRFRLQEGQKIIVGGSISVYERDGKYQMYANDITLDGAGDLYQAFEQMKVKLEEMGMFSDQFKKPIPPFCQTIGIVTAKTGAAIHDIINVATRRNPYVQLILYPALVQGDGASESIARGIHYLDQMGLDCIIVGRGGGSLEDLWAFNEEEVAWAIFNCDTPIISAVGHEVDVTIADYVADLRAPTPSAAAELAVFDYLLFEQSLEQFYIQLKQKMLGKIRERRSRVDQLQLHLQLSHPKHKINTKRQYLNDLEQMIYTLIEKKVQNNKHQLALLGERLQGLSPLSKIGGGYGYITNNDGKAVEQMEQVDVNDTISIQLADGKIKAEVKEKVITSFQ